LCGFEIYGGTEWAVKKTAAYDISTKSPRLKANKLSKYFQGEEGEKNIH